MAKNILITSALPYVNNIPHLGNIIGCVLSADVFARYCRLKGYNTLYICGTDEHGTATETKALEEGLTPKEICDKYYAQHKKIYEWFGCSFDHFGRTSTTNHKEITQHLFLRLKDKGYISEGILEQLYCKKCNMFLADRFVFGTCPHCNYDNARGDQCDKCGKLLNAIELINPRCKVCNETPEVKESKHLFFNLEKIQPQLEKWVDKQSKDGFWTQNAITTTKSWLKEGLKQRCISRDLKWGVPIPLKAYEKKVFYVWFDAPIGYISITMEHTKDWEKWWKNKNVKLYQFMAKDNIPFHTIIFPATLMGADENYTLLHHINSTEYLNYEDGKFSKSLSQGVFGDDAIESGIPADIWRYYLLVNRPEGSDTHFSWDDFQEKNNNELLANLGNFVNRSLVFAHKYFDDKIPEHEITKKDQEFFNQVDGEIDEITKLFEQVKIKDALKKIMHISKMGNQYFQENEPWKLVNDDKKKCGTVIYVCVNLVRTLAVLIHPFLPNVSKEIFNQLNLKNKFDWDSSLKQLVESGHKINEPKTLFRKLEDSEIKELKEKFKGGKKKSKKDFSILDLKVAKVLEVKDHPEADKLYVLKIDLGEERQIVAGMKPYYKKEELIGKNIVVIANLKPVKLRGIESNGMLLACTDKKDKKKVKLLEALNSKPGDDVFAVEKKPKDKVEFTEFIELKLEVKDGKVVWQDKILKTNSEDISVKDIKDGIVS